MNVVSTRKASRLVLDYTLYPRERVEDYHVREMVEALKAGRELPPLIADKKTLRVVDGFHRLKAHQRAYGPDAKIKVELREYEDDAEIFADAVRLNASHGRRLSRFDQARCIAKAEHLKMELGVISSLLNMRKETVEEMKVERFATYEMKPVVLKRSAAHLAGKELTAEQVDYNVKAGGMNQTFYINQVIAMLESDAVEWENDTTRKRLKKLYELLDKAIMVSA